MTSQIEIKESKEKEKRGKKDNRDFFQLVPGSSVQFQSCPHPKKYIISSPSLRFPSF
jgi:hypothetical protein